MDIQLISAFILYFIVLLTIGALFYARAKSDADFTLGNRSINYWVTAIATQASDMGSWLFLGFPAAVYMNGVFECWTAIGLITGMFLTWQFIAPRLRVHSEQYRSLTLASYLTKRFNDTRGILGIIGALFSCYFLPFYIASGLVSLSILFESAFGINYNVGITASLAATAAYTLIGGFVAVAWCNFFQGIFLLTMIVLVPLTAAFTLPSLSTIATTAHAHNIPLTLFTSWKDTFAALSLSLGWGLGYFGQPHILINFMAIDDPANLKRAQYLGITWQVMVLSAAAAIGLIGIPFFAQHGLIDSQLVFITMTQALFHPFFAGLILCAILAATLSTLDGLILVGGSTLAHDVYAPISGNTQPHRLLWLSKIGSLFVCGAALLIAWNSNQSVYFLVNYAWSGLGSTFGPLMLTALYYKNITYSGALVGVITGGLSAALWHMTYIPILPLVPGFFIGLVTIITISAITKK